MKVQNIMRGFLDALYPPICHLCGRLSDGKYPHCCPACFESFELIGPSSCELCGEPFAVEQASHLCLACIKKPPPFNWCRSVFLYQGAVTEALSGFKYKGNLSMQVPLEDALSKGLNAASLLPEADILVPVPLSRPGLRKRGFNQSYILAAQVALKLNIKVQADVLRKRDSIAQVGLSAKGRILNAEASFAPGKTIARVKGLTVLLFDDVYTTGATVRACSKILRKAGAKKISVLTLARAELGKG